MSGKTNRQARKPREPGRSTLVHLSPTRQKPPVLLLTRDTALEVLTGVTIAPITSTIRHIPTEVVLMPDEDGVLTKSAVNLDNLQTIPKSNLGGLIAILSPDKMEAVERALCFALGMDHLL